MWKRHRVRSASPLSSADRLGNVWAGIFLAIVLILLVTLVGKALFFKG